MPFKTDRMFKAFATPLILRRKRTARVLFFMCGLICNAPVQAGENHLKALYDEAVLANTNLRNARLQEIVSSHPEVLLERSRDGMSLTRFAFFYLNDDLVSQTNFEFIEFLIRHDFFGQDVDKAEHFGFAVQAMRGADRQIARIDLLDEMVFHKTRDPFIALLSHTIADRVSRNPFSSQESLELLLDVCDPKVFVAGQEKLLNTQLVTAVERRLSQTHRNFVETYVKTGTLNAVCVESFLN